MGKRPKLRTVNKVQPPYPLNRFPADFPYSLGREVVAMLATRDEESNPKIEGEEWEFMFAKCIGATWAPSNVGLDDIVLGSCAWSAKSVKSTDPHTQAKVRLISGRNSPTYSYDAEDISPHTSDPDAIGRMVLGIWNERVSAIYEKHPILRTVVLMKSENLTSLAVFEFDTVRYDPNDYYWKWNKRGNLQGHERESREHRFTWQPHGSQFTIVEAVPENRLRIRLRKPPLVTVEAVLDAIGFDDSWVELVE